MNYDRFSTIFLIIPHSIDTPPIDRRRNLRMSIVAELLTQPGVLAAGEYAYRGDRFSYRGNLSEAHARIASIMCRATTMSTHMQGEIVAALSPKGFQPLRGWAMRGPAYTVCVVANVFCLLDNQAGAVNPILAFMRRALAHDPMDLI
jgi:roadblock/LC7 domain-containing protein